MPYVRVNRLTLKVSEITCSVCMTAFVFTSQGAAEGRTAHNNVWNGVNGMVSDTWNPCVGCVPYRSIDSIPDITMSTSVLLHARQEKKGFNKLPYDKNK